MADSSQLDLEFRRDLEQLSDALSTCDIFVTKVMDELGLRAAQPTPSTMGDHQVTQAIIKDAMRAGVDFWESKTPLDKMIKLFTEQAES